MNQTFVACVPGILANVGPAGWEDAMAAAINQLGNGNVAAAVDYWTGVFGWANKTKTQKRLAAILSGAMGSNQTPRLACVTHSFGSVILLGAMQKYTMTTELDEWHAIAAACPEDCEANGLNRLLREGRIGRAVFYVSWGDTVLKRLAPLQRWRGFGQMGYHGPENLADDVKHLVTIVRDDEQDHASWVYSDFRRTLDRILTAPP